MVLRENYEDFKQDPNGELARAECIALAEMLGLKATASWEWALLERVSTGLYLLLLGITEEGTMSLRIADHWVATM